MFTKIIVKDNVHYIGVNDRKTSLFENMWPLEKGVSYNSYLVTGEKNVILDPAHGNFFSGYLANIKATLGDGKVDYLVVNHMEPDHSSSVTLLMKQFPEMKLIGNAKTKEFLQAFYKIDTTDVFVEVKDGQTLTLGDNEFTFYTTPMVHWPESMVTYHNNTKTLFSQDAFGGFGALDGSIFDDEQDWEDAEYETRRYFTNIVGKFSTQILRAIDKLAKLDIQTICPDHGIVWRKEPAKIINYYKSLSNHETKNGVVIAYGSMYGNTEKMADTIANTLAKEGVEEVKIFDVSKTHPSHILAEIWKYKGLVLGSCSYNNALYPPMQELYHILEINKLKNHVVGIFGTYGWSGGGVKTLVNLPKNNPGFDFIEETIDVRCAPGEEDIDRCIQLAKEVVKRMK